MAEFHDDMRALAVEMIGEFGSGLKATIYRRGVVTFNPVTQAESGGSEVGHQIIAVTAALGKDADPALVAREALVVYVPATGLAIVPKAGDQLALPARDGRYVVEMVKPYDPDGAHIAFELTVVRP